MTLTTRSYRPVTSAKSPSAYVTRGRVSGPGDAKTLRPDMDGDDLVVSRREQNGQSRLLTTQIVGGCAVASDEDASETGGKRPTVQLVVTVVAGGDIIE
jgi:hypothetical protein